MYIKNSTLVSPPFYCMYAYYVKYWEQPFATLATVVRKIS